MAESQVYTWEQVADHINRDSVWLVMDGGVYDVTSYLSEHPGSEKPLLKYAGQDCSAQFKKVGHSEGAFKVRESKKIGRIEDKEPTQAYWLKIRHNNWQDKKFTPKDIKQNKDWVIFQNKVYDLSTLADKNNIDYAASEQYIIGVVDRSQEIAERQACIKLAGLGVLSVVAAYFVYKKLRK